MGLHVILSALHQMTCLLDQSTTVYFWLICCCFLVMVAFFSVHHDCSMFDIFSWVIFLLTSSFHLKSYQKSPRYGSFQTDLCESLKKKKIFWLSLFRASALALLMKLGLFNLLRMPTVQRCTCILPRCIVKVSFVNCFLHCTDNSEGKQFRKCMCDFPMQTEKRAQSVCCFTMLNIRSWADRMCFLVKYSVIDA